MTTPLLADTDDVVAEPPSSSGRTARTSKPASSKAKSSRHGHTRGKSLSLVKHRKGKNSKHKRHGGKADDGSDSEPEGGAEGAKSTLASVKAMLGLEPQVAAVLGGCFAVGSRSVVGTGSSQGRCVGGHVQDGLCHPHAKADGT